MCVNSTNVSCKVDVLQGLAYSPLFIVGVLVNAAALRAFIAKWDSWTDAHVYMFNLVIADTFFILFLPFRIYDAFFCLPKTTLCTVLLYVHFINMYASIMTMTAISVQRYLSIRFPLQTRLWRRRKRAALVVCLIIWGFLLIICAVFRKENHPENLWTCYERCKDHQLRVQIIVILIVVGFLAPLVVIVFCFSQIVRILSKAGDKSEEKRSIVGIVMANMIVFMVCYTPIHIAFLVNYLYTPPPNWQFVYMPPHVYLQVSEWIAATNCCFDCISYYFLLKQFYSSVSETLKTGSTIHFSEVK